MIEGGGTTNRLVLAALRKLSYLQNILSFERALDLSLELKFCLDDVDCGPSKHRVYQTEERRDVKNLHFNDR